MKIETDVLRNELQEPIEIGDTTEEFNAGWSRCAEEVEKAIQRAEKKTMQVDEVPHDIPGVSDAVQDFWKNTEILTPSKEAVIDELLEVRITKYELDELKERAEDRDYYKGKADAYESVLYAISESEG